MRLIELSFRDDAALVERLMAASERAEPLDTVLSEPTSRGRRVLRLVFGDGEGQAAINAINGLMDGLEDWRLVVLPVEASLPKPNPSPR